MDNLRQVILKTTRAQDIRKELLRSIATDCEAKYHSRQVLQAFFIWRAKTHPHLARRRSEVGRVMTQRLSGGSRLGVNSNGRPDTRYNRILAQACPDPWALDQPVSP
jgi:hypothetical protein